MEREDKDPAEQYPSGVPLQTTEDHLGRLIGRQPTEVDVESLLTRQEERAQLVEEDDEALLPAEEVENAEDDVIDADDDDATRSNNLTPEELSDSTQPKDLLSQENERPSQEGHTVSSEDKPG